VNTRRTTAERYPTHTDTQQYNAALAAEDRAIAELLAREIAAALPGAQNKIWHAHPVWFLNGNPIVGYSKLKHCVRLLFWRRQSFDEDAPQKEGTFTAAEVRYSDAAAVSPEDVARWCTKARDIQWDYKNLIRRKGSLERLKSSIPRAGRLAHA